MQHATSNKLIALLAAIAALTAISAAASGLHERSGS
jgi:hypothetical protein